jgi:hypothetical protein
VGILLLPITAKTAVVSGPGLELGGPSLARRAFSLIAKKVFWMLATRVFLSPQTKHVLPLFSVRTSTRVGSAGGRGRQRKELLQWWISCS